jgi:predicted metal-dependent phosphoesterase TrpH
MPGFTRNKLVSVRVRDDDTLLVHGILNDDLYCLEMDVFISINGLQIKDIKGKWNRWTTTECYRAIPFLSEAIGFSMKDDGFSQKIHRSVGRRSCRHFANLLLECCYTAKEATRLIQKKDKHIDRVEKVENKDIFENSNENRPEKDKNQGREPIKTGEIHFTGKRSPNKAHGIIIDLHTHSFPASQCSSMSVENLIKQAKLIGLDGICLTDHNYVWDNTKIEDLRQKHGFLVLGGNEITTDQGDVLVFGLDKDIQGIIGLKDLRREVNAKGGFMIAAHPFRGFLMFGVSKLGLTLKEAKNRTIFKYVDAIEVMNAKVTIEENGFASEVATALGFRKTGGSDAHETNEVGHYATIFQTTISDEKDLIEALHELDYEPIAFQKEKRKKDHERG